MKLGPVMVDVAGTALTPEDVERLRHPQAGSVILFARNFESPAQLVALARAIRVGGRVEPLFVEEVPGVADAVRAIARDGDVVLIMGAGSIGQVAPQLAAGPA